MKPGGESLQDHYLQSCAMLTECWECDELVEIRDLENHLIASCP